MLFANYRISTLKSDAGFGKKVVRGVTGGDRLLHTVERPAFLAKNRFGLAGDAARSTGRRSPPASPSTPRRPAPRHASTTDARS